jgi:hypothetical protein
MKSGASATCCFGYPLDTKKEIAAATVMDEVPMGFGVKPAVDGFTLK